MVEINENNQDRIARFFFWVAVISITFVVYGSLVPFTYRDYNFQDSVNIFLNIPYLSLGVSSRADWFANAIIYIPVSFAWCGYFAASHRPKSSYVFLTFCLISLAIAIEYVQIFITPRTVSLNDLLAEVSGIAIGIGLWFGLKNFTLSHLDQFYRTGKISIRSILIIYATGYLLFSFFPYDFYFSGAELVKAFETKGVPLFGLGNWQKIDLTQIAIWGVKFSLVLPFGYLYRLYRAERFPSFKAMVFGAFALFLLLDLAQYFTASGNSFIVSVLVNAAGFMAGAESAKRWPLENAIRHRQQIKKVIYLGLFPFLTIALGVKGWHLTPAGSFETIQAHLDKINFIPFYYHYYTTEVHALLSLLAQFFLVIPVALLLIMRDWTEDKPFNRNWKELAFWGGLFSLLIEAGGLFWADLKPDPTNLLIGAVGVVLAYKLGGLILDNLSGGTQDHSEELLPKMTQAKISQEKNTEKTKVRLAFLFIAFAAALGATGYVLNYPLSKPILLLGVVGYMVLLSYRPVMWLIVVAVAIPILDLYPLSGRFFMTEFDFVILVTVIFKYGTGQVSGRFLKKDLPWMMLLCGVTLVYFFSTVRMLWPFPHMGAEVDLNMFNSYYSDFNSLRIIKGFFWSLLLLPALEYDLRKDVLSFIRLSYGMIIGLAIVCLVVVLERGLFTGLFNFSSSSYRVTGSFASMHTGGSHIDGYLVTMLPFIAVPVLLKTKIREMLPYGALLILVLYTIFVTYSRGPYLVSAGVTLLLAGGLVVATRKKVKKSYLIMTLLGFMVIGGGWLILPMAYDTVLSKRLEGIEKDQHIRLDHWENSLQDMGRNLPDLLLGYGPGSFPKNLYLDYTAKGKNIAVHYLVAEGDNQFLRMYGGDNLYTSQFVSLNPEKKYYLRLKVKSQRESVGVTLPLCERWITDSFRCTWMTLKVDTSSGKWVDVGRDIDMSVFQKSLSRFDNIIRRPITLSIFTEGSGRAVDIDDLEIIDNEGRNLIKNSGFEQGKDRWFFTVDNHLLWHAKNLTVNIIYDLGVLGLFFIGGLLLLVISRLIRMILAGEQLAAVFLASLGGYLGVGIVGSLFDVPQLSFLLFFLVNTIMIMWQEEAA